MVLSRNSDRAINDRYQNLDVTFRLSLLEMPEVRHYVDNPHQSPNNFMYDVIDVEYLREHPLIIRNPRALHIFLHTDDMNPLGSHVKK